MVLTKGDQLFTASDNGTQFGLSSESHLANTLLHPQLQKPSGNYTGACVILVTQKQKARRDPEGQQNPAPLSPLSLCKRHLIQTSPQHSHLLYYSALSSASDSSRRNQSKALLTIPLETSHAQESVPNIRVYTWFDNIGSQYITGATFPFQVFFKESFLHGTSVVRVFQLTTVAGFVPLPGVKRVILIYDKCNRR